jgi:hypothetical protein
MDPAPTLQGSATVGNGSQSHAWSWSPADGVTDPAAQSPRAFRPGTFTLTVTDLGNGCTSTDTVEVARDAGLPVANAGPDAVLDCDVTVASLVGSVTEGDGSRGFRFSWEPAGDVASPSAPSTTTTIPGTYVLTVTDVATGCLSIDTVAVSQVVPPAPVEPSDLRRPGAEPLRVVKLDRAASQVRVTWEAVAAGLEHRLHEGTLAGLWVGGYDHGFAACALPAPQHVLRPGAGGRYWLATSANCAGDESAYGRDSLGRDRPTDLAASGRACP